MKGNLIPRCMFAEVEEEDEEVGRWTLFEVESVKAKPWRCFGGSSVEKAVVVGRAGFLAIGGLLMGCGWRVREEDQPAGREAEGCCACCSCEEETAGEEAETEEEEDEEVEGTGGSIP